MSYFPNLNIFNNNNHDPILKEREQQLLTIKEIGADATSEIIRERETCMIQIESDILDINNLMIDMSVLLQEQGLDLDNIENNIDKAVTHTNQGNKELEKAAKYNKNTGFIGTIIGATTVIVTGGIVALLLI